jgi:hypothetical protein
MLPLAGSSRLNSSLVTTCPVSGLDMALVPLDVPLNLHKKCKADRVRVARYLTWDLWLYVGQETRQNSVGVVGVRSGCDIVPVGRCPNDLVASLLLIDANILLLSRLMTCCSQPSNAIKAAIF